MFTHKHILASLTLLTYCTTGHAMELESFGTRKQLPSFQLLDRIAAPDYEANRKDEKQLVKLFAFFKEDTCAQDELPKMVLAASAWLTLFEAPKEDRETTMNDINKMVEMTENFYLGQCTSDKQQVDQNDKLKTAHFLNLSPFIYRGANSTLFAQIQNQTSLKLQFDELQARFELVSNNLTKVDQLTKNIEVLTSSMSENLRTQVQANMTIGELQTSLKLTKKLLELNKVKTVERMKFVNDSQKDSIEQCEALVTTAQNDLDQTTKDEKATEEEKAGAARALKHAKKDLDNAHKHAKIIKAELDEVTNSGWSITRMFGFSGH